MKKKVFQLLVDNTSGVLSRISGLFSRRGYNIESITAGTTADARITRITIVASGDDEILKQIEKQVAKLEDVRDVKELKPDSSVYRELALIKVKVSAKERQGVIAVADIFRANIIDVSPEGLIIELTGNQDKVDLIKPGDLVHTEGHVGMVIGTSDTMLKVANMREGVKISYIKKSNGQSTNNDKSFDSFVLFDEFFAMYGN